MDEATLDRFDMTFKRARQADEKPPRVLYHYTTAGGFEGIVRSRAIRATNFSFMNDPSEIMYGLRLVTQRLAATRDRLLVQEPAIARFLNGALVNLGKELSEVYVASFSSSRDDLSQWRAYGGTPARFALGVRSSAIDEATTRDYPHLVWFSRVLYKYHEQLEMVNGVLRAAIEFLRRENIPDADMPAFSDRLSRGLQRMLPGLKEPAYRSEEEWRIVIMARAGVDAKLAFDSSKGVLRPYLLFPLEIRPGHPLALDNLTVLAPARPEAAIKAASMVLRNVGIEGVDPRPSGIPFAD